MFDRLEAHLGAAVTPIQLQRTLGFFFVWLGLSIVSEKLAPKRFEDQDDRLRFADRVTAGTHSVAIIGLCVWILTDPTQTANIDADHLYGYSDGVALLFALTCGYFLWDIYTCLNKSTIEVGFLIHAIACFFCYLFGQFPYLHYYGVRFLLFELSSPLLTLMMLLRQFGMMGRFHDLVQSSFGITFVGCRIFYGLPLSFMFFQETIQLWNTGTPHSSFVVVYYWLANCALNSLNIFWLFTMMSKRSKKSK